MYGLDETTHTKRERDGESVFVCTMPMQMLCECACEESDLDETTHTKSEGSTREEKRREKRTRDGCVETERVERKKEEKGRNKIERCEGRENLHEERR